MAWSNIPADIASRLKKGRRALGLSKSNVESLMSGKRSPTPAVVDKLIEALELDDDFAAELRSREGSRYQSGFAQGEAKHTSGTD